MYAGSVQSLHPKKLPQTSFHKKASTRSLCGKKSSLHDNAGVPTSYGHDVCCQLLIPQKYSSSFPSFEFILPWNCEIRFQHKLTRVALEHQDKRVFIIFKKFDLIWQTTRLFCLWKTEWCVHCVMWKTFDPHQDSDKKTIHWIRNWKSEVVSSTSKKNVLSEQTVGQLNIMSRG